MGQRPSQLHSLDRINVNGDYEPSNCRWATAKVQGNNTRANRVIEYNGARRTLSEWAERIGIKPHTLGWRLRSGWPLDKAMVSKT
jgi:hypothetical protein